MIEQLSNNCGNCGSRDVRIAAELESTVPGIARSDGRVYFDLSYFISRLSKCLSFRHHLRLGKGPVGNPLILLEFRNLDSFTCPRSLVYTDSAFFF